MKGYRRQGIDNSLIKTRKKSKTIRGENKYNHLMKKAYPSLFGG